MICDIFCYMPAWLLSRHNGFLLTVNFLFSGYFSAVLQMSISLLSSPHVLRKMTSPLVHREACGWGPNESVNNYRLHYWFKDKWVPKWRPKRCKRLVENFLEGIFLALQTLLLSMDLEVEQRSRDLSTVILLPKGIIFLEDNHRWQSRGAEDWKIECWINESSRLWHMTYF